MLFRSDTIVEWMEKNQAGIAKNCNDKGNYSNSTALTVKNGLYAYHRLESLTAAANAANKASQDAGNGNVYSARGYQGIYKTNPATVSLGYDGGITKDESDAYGFSNLEYRATTYYSYNLYKEIQTGSVEETKINNIYDMAGNMWEWTTETGNPDGSSTTRAVLRGGSFNGSGSGGPVCSRSGTFSTGGYDTGFGFRVVLYIK